jgi:hypothetical protein
MLSTYAKNIMREQAKNYIQARQWPETFACLSPLEQRIMVVVAEAALGINGGNIARKCLADRQVTDRMVTRLEAAGLICAAKTAPAGKLYTANDPGMREYCQSLDKFMVWGDAIREVQQDFYDLAAQRFEAMEGLGLIFGNGHHMAQKISQLVENDLRERWRKKS